MALQGRTLHALECLSGVRKFHSAHGNCSSPKQNFVFVISSTCPVLNWEWSEIWIELRKWSASLYSALQSNSWSGVLSGLQQSAIQKMDWIDKWIALQKQLWIWIVDCTPKMLECQMPWCAVRLVKMNLPKFSHPWREQIRSFKRECRYFDGYPKLKPLARERCF